jgi:hypothetical protein
LGFKIGHKFLINLGKSTRSQIVLENNVDKDGIIIYLLMFLKMLGLWRNKINFSNYIESLVINGNKFPKILLEGNFILYS